MLHKHDINAYMLPAASDQSTESVSEMKTTMTSSNGNIYRVTGPLCGEFTGNRWIPLTKASDAGLWCLFHLRLE